MSSPSELVPQFCELTGASPQQAAEYLEASQNNIEGAVAAFFADQDDEPTAPASPPPAQAPVEPAYTGPRTLDGRPAPQSVRSSALSSSKRPPKRTGLATLSSLSGGHSHDDDDDDDDDDDQGEGRGPRDLFAGGEKSGLAVQDPAQRSSDPRKLINDIVAKAKANSKRPDTGPMAPATGARTSTRFRGAGQTVGGDGVESRLIPDPQGQPIPTVAPTVEGNVQERVLHLWQDGFSIDDGELHRFDDPANRTDLQMIRQGRAPLHLMNIRVDEPVDVKLQQHNENYHPLPKVYRPFGGEGYRLGSPVPGETPPATTTTVPAASPAAQSSGPSTGADESQPTLTLRIQLPDGTRMPARFNRSQTVGDVYEFVARASPAMSSRSWVIATTFPNKEHTDRDLVLGEMPEFRKGGTAVVKWA